MDDPILDNSAFVAENEALSYDNVNRIIFYLLDAWCSFIGKRKEWYGKDIRGSLPIIEFEKLAVFVARVWKKLYKSASKSPLSVSFPFPYEELPGKHGYSLGKSNYHQNGEPAYFSDILILQTKNGVRHCFRFEIPERRKDFYKTMVSPAIKLPSEDKLFDKFNSFEKEVLRNIYNAIKHLGVSQIRALGTHDSRWRALKDVRYEAVKWQTAVKDVRYLLNSQYDEGKASALEDEAQKMLEYADEAWRKSLYNREDYREARELILQEINNDLLKETIKKCQKGVDDIWDCAEMTTLTSEAIIAHAISKYIRGIAYFRQNPDDLDEKKRQSKKYWHQANEGISTLTNLGIDILPPITDVFLTGGRDLKREILIQISEIINKCETFLSLKENSS